MVFIGGQNFLNCTKSSSEPVNLLGAQLLMKPLSGVLVVLSWGYKSSILVSLLIIIIIIITFIMRKFHKMFKCA